MDQRGPSSDESNTVPLAYASAAPPRVYPGVLAFGRLLAVVAGVAAIQNLSLIAAQLLQQPFSTVRTSDWIAGLGAHLMLAAVEIPCAIFAWRMGGTLSVAAKRAQTAFLVWAIVSSLYVLLALIWTVVTIAGQNGSSGSSVLVIYTVQHLVSVAAHGVVPWAGYLWLRWLRRSADVPS